MEHQTHEAKIGFFEKYQTFFSIIIAGLLIGGGIVLSKTIPQTSTGTAAAPQGQTESQVRADLVKTAKSLSLNGKALGVCLDKKSKEGIISAASTLATKSGVAGTPTFFILKRTYAADGTVTSEKQIPVIGARDKATFMAAIEQGKTPDGQPKVTGEKIILSDSDHYLGPKNAAITIVEYSDIDCPFCKRAKPTIDEILSEHPDYAFIYRHAPLAQLHPWANYKAQATECIYETAGIDGFWKFLDVIAK